MNAGRTGSWRCRLFRRRPKPLNLLLQVQCVPFKITDRRIVERRMRERILDLKFELAVFALQVFEVNSTGSFPLG